MKWQVVLLDTRTRWFALSLSARPPSKPADTARCAERNHQRLCRQKLGCVLSWDLRAWSTEQSLAKGHSWVPKMHASSWLAGYSEVFCPATTNHRPEWEKIKTILKSQRESTDGSGFVPISPESGLVSRGPAFCKMPAQWGPPSLEKICHRELALLVYKALTEIEYQVWAHKLDILPIHVEFF